MSSAIKIDNIRKSFGKTVALDGISFEVAPGEIMGFLGPNGAGKTTTIRCLMDFLRPDSGQVTVLGKNAQVESANLKKDIGFLGGDVHLYNDWTGDDHIRLIKRIRVTSTNERELIDRLQFDPKKRVKSLSTGNRQKLGLILALMHQPKLLVLDEPTNGLDPILQNTIYTLLQEAAAAGTTILMSSHNLSEVEKICDRVTIIRQGKIVATEKIRDLVKKRIYHVTAQLTKPVGELKLGAHMERLDSESHVLKLRAQGDIQPVLALLSKLELADLEIMHASLEETFLKFYE